MDRNETVELAQDLVELTDDLHAGGDRPAALHRLVELMVKHLQGCAWASITVTPSRGRTTILASSDEVADRSVPVEYQGDGVLAYSLVGADERRLILHPESAEGFDDATIADAAMFAAQASSLLALSDALNTVAGLEAALAGSRDIGAAIGVLMVRRTIGRAAAFDVLRRASQHSQVKLRDVAAGFLQTGRLPDDASPATTRKSAKGASMTETRTDTAKVAELAKDIRIAMLTTVDAESHFVSRPMAQQEVEFDGALWFFAERDSRKVAHIMANPYVGVTLTSNDTWISLSGHALVVDDVAKARDLWNSWVEAWMPQGPDDDSVVLIKVTAETAEYWDTPGGRVASVLSFAKAKLTGRRYDGGENERVAL